MVALLPCCVGFSRELVTENWCQEWDNIGLYFDRTRFLGLNDEVIPELASAERVTVQAEDQHLVLRAA